MATVEDARTESRPFIRPDGKDKVTGGGRYTADMTLTGMLHARFVYAPSTHARLLRVDTAKARALPGVLAVITHADVPDVLHGPFVPDRRLFAKDVVRFEGDVVAAVAALTPEIAEAAAALVEIEIEELPAVSDPELALAGSASLIHPEWESYEAAEDVVRSGNSASRSTIVKGDADAAMAEAEVVVRGRYVADMSHAAPIEPHAVIAQWEGDQVTIWSSTQVPFPARSTVAHTLQLPESSVRVIVPLLGGGFGGKCEPHFEAHVAALARAARRPVKLVFSRREEFTVPDHRREGMAIELETGVDRDGTLVARRGSLVIDNGAYTADAAFFPQLAAMHAVGALPGAAHLGRGRPRLHEQRAVRLGARPHGASGLLGARAAPRCRGPRDRDGSGRAAPPQHRARGRRGARPARSSTRSAPPRRSSGRAS